MTDQEDQDEILKNGLEMKNADFNLLQSKYLLQTKKKRGKKGKLICKVNKNFSVVLAGIKTIYRWMEQNTGPGNTPRCIND